MAETPIGDLVLFEDDQRLDAVDARALQVLIYQCVADALGGLMGETSGVLGGVDFDTANPAAVGVGECVLAGFKRSTGSSARVEGVIIHYNPAGNYQSQVTLPTLAPYAAGEETPYVWFCRAETAADRATRKRYQAGQERSFTPLTRLRQNVRFGVTIDRTSPPDANNDWFVFGQVSDWVGGIPTITPISPFDIGIEPAAALQDGYFVGATVRKINQLPAEDGPFIHGPSVGPWANGLARIITYLGQALAQTNVGSVTFASDGSTTPSETGPFLVTQDGGSRGRQELDAALATAEQDIEDLQAELGSGAIASLLRTATLMSGTMTSGGTFTRKGIRDGMDVITDHPSTGVYDITFETSGLITSALSTVQITVKSSTAARATYDWSSLYVLRVYIFDASGVADDLPFSLTIGTAVGIAASDL